MAAVSDGHVSAGWTEHKRDLFKGWNAHENEVGDWYFDRAENKWVWIDDNATLDSKWPGTQGKDMSGAKPGASAGKMKPGQLQRYDR